MCELGITDYTPRREPFSSAIGDALLNGEPVFVRAFLLRDPQGMQLQSSLYRALGSLVPSFTPHVTRLIAEQRCTGAALAQALLGAAAPAQHEATGTQLDALLTTQAPQQ